MPDRAQYHRVRSETLDEIWVSKYSRWSDEVWQFERTTAGSSKNPYRLSWNFRVTPDSRFTDAQHATLLECWKRAIWCLFSEPGDGLFRKFNNCGHLTTTLKFLVEWMVRQGHGDLSMLQPDEADRFIEYLTKCKGPTGTSYSNWDAQDQLEEKAEITANALAKYLQIWLVAYWARDALTEVGLPAFPNHHPFRGRTAIEVALGITTRLPQKIPEIPDELFVPLMNHSFDVIQGRWVEPFVALSTRLAVNRPAKTFRDEERRTTDRDVCEADLARLNLLRRGERGIDAFRRILARLDTACIAIIQGLTGMRISEVCGLPGPHMKKKRRDGLPDILEIEPSFDNEYEIFYVRGNVYKHRSSPEPTRWVLGMRPIGSEDLPPPVKAIEILCKLYDGWRKFGSVDRLIVSFANSGAIPFEPEHVQPALSGRLRKSQQEYARRLATETGAFAAWQFSTHSWRKTFARYMIRTNKKLLPALSHHFKHMSVAMTEVAYCQGNAETAQLLREARVFEAGDVICDVITGEGPVFGPVAQEIQELSNGLKGRLANRSNPDRMEDVRAAVRERDIQLYDSGFGWCVFRGDGARCHDLVDRAQMISMRFAPAFENVTPEICHKCKNFGVSPDHKGFWAERLDRDEALLKKQKRDPSCTTRHVVRRRIEQSRTVIGWIRRGGDPRATEN